jgi:uncharacterized repeat protein (TIGR01451 family)
MYRLQYRRFDTEASLMVNHTVNVGQDRAAIRWYELRINSTGVLGIHQQGTYAPDGNHRWMGSIAMDGAGNIALGFSVSGPNTFPSIRYTGRLFNDPLGTMPQGEATIIAGGGSQTHPASRWGDYSMMAVDPSDDCTFWYTQEYYSTTSQSDWRTRVGSFKFPSCARADLSIAVADAPDPVVAGNDLTYALTATNVGPDAATGVEVLDTLPVEVTFKSATASQGSCQLTGSTVACTLGALAAGASGTVRIVVTPTVAGAITNRTGVRADQFDPSGANNLATAVTTVLPPPLSEADLSIAVADAPDPVVAGNDLTYTLTVTNNGPAAATGVTGSDALPAGVTFKSTSSSQGSCEGTGSSVTCTLGALAPSATATVQIVVTPTVVGAITNTVSVRADQPDPSTANNVATAVTTVLPPASGADLAITTVTVPRLVFVGEDLSYILTVTNHGPDAATGVTVVDTLSPLVTFNLATASQGFCEGTGSSVTCTLGTVAPGASATVEIVVTAVEPGAIRSHASVGAEQADPNTTNNVSRSPAFSLIPRDFCDSGFQRRCFFEM